MRAVWPGVFVSDDSIGQCIKDIRRALGDDEKQMLRTVPRRGFLFTPQIQRETVLRPRPILPPTPPENTPRDSRVAGR